MPRKFSEFQNRVLAQITGTSRLVGYDPALPVGLRNTNYTLDDLEAYLRTNIQEAYTQSASGLITTDGTRLALKVKDGTGVASNSVFSVLNNSDSLRFDVTSERVFAGDSVNNRYVLQDALGLEVVETFGSNISRLWVLENYTQLSSIGGTTKASVETETGISGRIYLFAHDLSSANQEGIQIQQNLSYFQSSTSGFGLRYLGFGETNITTPGAVDYSTLAFNSLVPKKYVDDAIAAAGVPDPLRLSDGSAAAPTYSNATNTGSGLYFSRGTGIQRTLIAAGGVEIGRFYRDTTGGLSRLGINTGADPDSVLDVKGDNTNNADRLFSLKNSSVEMWNFRNSGFLYYGNTLVFSTPSATLLTSRLPFYVETSQNQVLRAFNTTYSDEIRFTFAGTPSVSAFINITGLPWSKANTKTAITTVPSWQMVDTLNMSGSTEQSPLLNMQSTFNSTASGFTGIVPITRSRMNYSTRLSNTLGTVKQFIADNLSESGTISVVQINFSSEPNFSLSGGTTDIVGFQHNPTNATGLNKNIAFWAKNGQMGLGMSAYSSINASAILELSSTTQGFLLPRMTATQASAITGVNGLVLYVTDTNGTFTSVGFWGYENGAWVKL